MEEIMEEIMECGAKSKVASSLTCTKEDEDQVIIDEGVKLFLQQQQYKRENNKARTRLINTNTLTSCRNIVKTTKSFSYKRILMIWSSVGVIFASLGGWNFSNYLPLFFTFAFSSSNHHHHYPLCLEGGSRIRSRRFITYQFLDRRTTHSYNPSSSHNHHHEVMMTTVQQENALDSSSSPPSTKEDFQKLTVKQLKNIVSDMKTPVKKSHLKRKADIIDFLLQEHDDFITNTSTASSSPSNDKASEIVKEKVKAAVSKPGNNINKNVAAASTVAKTRPSRHSLKRMPSLNIEEEADEESKRTDTTGSSDVATEQQKSHKNAKDILFEELMNRYPPLRSLHEASDEEVFDQQQHDTSTNNNENGVTTTITTTTKSVASENSLLQKLYTGTGDADIRQKYHPMLLNAPKTSDMDMIFLGTASCIPGTTRGVSCTALRLGRGRGDSITSSVNHNPTGDRNIGGNNGGVWIFDCGESSQLQLQRSNIRAGSITKIFITHVHGDHTFGLPGLICFLGQNCDRRGPPLEIYGPEGLRMWLRTTMRFSCARVSPPYRVHELMDVPMAPDWKRCLVGGHIRYYHERERWFKGNQSKQQKRPRWGTQGCAGEDENAWISRAPLVTLDPCSRFGEVDGGRDIFPIYDHPKCVNGAPIWEVEVMKNYKIYAAPMSHGVPCVGYTVMENDKPGHLRVDLVKSIVDRNIEGLKESGMKVPMKVLALIKDLQEGGSYTFPDGTVVYQKDVVEPRRSGRKIVICGDTADSHAISGIGEGADILIHEATNTFLKGIDNSKGVTPEMVVKDTMMHGHSTPFSVGKLAKKMKVKRLVMNHFSSRYKGDQSIESISIMTRIEKQAIKASGLSEDTVAAAWDFMKLPIPMN